MGLNTPTDLDDKDQRMKCLKSLHYTANTHAELQEKLEAGVNISDTDEAKSGFWTV